VLPPHGACVTKATTKPCHVHVAI